MSDFGSFDSEPHGFDDYSDYEDYSSDLEFNNNLHFMSNVELNLHGNWPQNRRQANSQLSSVSEFSFDDNEELEIDVVQLMLGAQTKTNEPKPVETLLEVACLKAASSFTFDLMYSLKIPLSDTAWRRLLRLQFPRSMKEMKSAIAIYSFDGCLENADLEIKVLQQIGCVLYGEVRDASGRKFKVHCLGDRGKIAKSRCSACRSGFCSHVQKVIFTYVRKSGFKHIHLPISHDLNKLNRDQLQSLIQQVLSRNKYSNLLLLTKRIADECAEVPNLETERDYSLGSTSNSGPHWYFKKQSMTEKIERVFRAQKEGHLVSFLPAQVGHFRLGLNSELENLKKTNLLSIVEKWKCVDSYFGSTAGNKEFVSNVLKLLQRGDLTCIPLIELSIDVIISLSKGTSSISTDNQLIVVQPSLNPSDKENHALNTILLIIISLGATESIERRAKTEAIDLLRRKLMPTVTELDVSYKSSKCKWDGIAFMDSTIAIIDAISDGDLSLDSNCNFKSNSEFSQHLSLSSLIFLYRAQCEINSVYPPLFPKIVSCLDTNLKLILKNLKSGNVPWKGELWAVCFIISRIPDGELKSCLLEVILMSFVSLPNPTYDDLCWMQLVLNSVKESSLDYIQSDERPGYVFFEVLCKQVLDDELVEKLNCFSKWLSPLVECNREAIMEKLTFILNAKWFDIVREEKSDEICEKQLTSSVRILSSLDTKSIEYDNDLFRKFIVPHFDGQLISGKLTFRHFNDFCFTEMF